MAKFSHETLNIPSSLSQPMKIVVDMSSLDLALVAIFMCVFRFLRQKYESHPVEPTRIEPQPVGSKSQDSSPVPPFKLYVTPPSTPVKEHSNRNSADVSSSETAVSHHVETEKGAPSSSPRSFPLDRQSSKKAQGEAPPSPPSSVTSNKSTKSNQSGASTKSDTTGEPIKRRSTQEDSAFNSFKRLCDVHGLLKRPEGLGEHDVVDGINDEATLLYVTFGAIEMSFLCTVVFQSDKIPRRFFYAKQCNVSVAHNQFKEASVAREVNQLCSFFENIDVHAYEETRNLVSLVARSDYSRAEYVPQYPQWIGRRDKKGQPICMFDIDKLDSKTMAAFKESSAKMEVKRSGLKMQGIVSTEVRTFLNFICLGKITT